MLDPGDKTDKSKINALNKDKAVLEERIAKTDTILEAINGQLTDVEAKHLILKKLYDIASTELERYLNAEKRQLVSGVEKLWASTPSSSRELEHARDDVLKKLHGFLNADWGTSDESAIELANNDNW